MKYFYFNTLVLVKLHFSPEKMFILVYFNTLVLKSLNVYTLALEQF